jgi:ABC-type transporter Mla MlaB component
VRLAEDVPGRYRLSGSVDYQNVLDIRAQVEAVLDAEPEVELSFAQVTDGNSLLVALMMGWFRYAHHRGHAVRFTDVHALLHALIEFSGLQTVLPIDAVADANAANVHTTS